MDETDWTERDALLLAFAELAGYGIVTVAGAAGSAAQARSEILAALRERAPYELGCDVFWLAGDEHLFAAGGRPPLHAGGAGVQQALAAALVHQGLRAAA
jgi:hypothetical protein